MQTSDEFMFEGLLGTGTTPDKGKKKEQEILAEQKNPPNFLSEGLLGTGSSKPVTSMSALPKGSTPEPLGIPAYTGNKAEEYMSQFFGTLANSIGNSVIDLANIPGEVAGMVGIDVPKIPNVNLAPTPQGLPGEVFVRTGGNVTGQVPAMLLMAKAIGDAIKRGAEALPKGGRLLIHAARAFFTEEALREAISNSVDFYQAYQAGDQDGMAHAASMALIDTAFSGLMAKGWINDAKTLARIKAEMEAARFARAKNVTPEPPKTLAEAKTQALAAAAPKPEPAPVEPSPELQTKVDAKEVQSAAAKKVKEAKVKKAPETPEQRKVRMAKVRDAKKKKAEAAAAVPAKVEAEPDRLESKQTELTTTDKVRHNDNIPVDSKIEQTAPTPIDEGPIVTKEQIDAMEQFYGKGLEDISESEVEAFLAGKPSAPTKVRTPAVEEPEPSEEELEAIILEFAPDRINSLVQRRDAPTPIEQHYGKPIEQITEEEIDKFFDLEKTIDTTVPADDLDYQISEPAPEAVISDKVGTSPFRSEREGTLARTKVYNRSSFVAEKLSQLTSPDPNNFKDPSTTLQKLLNDVNRWLDGEEVDIEKTRNFLSDIAVHADEMKYAFEDPDDPMWPDTFNEWKIMAKDAATWARNVKSNIVKMRSGGPSTQEITSALRGWHSALKQYAEDKLGGRATGKQIKATLRKGSTKDEWNNVNLDKLLKDDVVYNKQEILEKIGERTVEFRDVILDEDPKFSIYVEPGRSSNYKELFVTAPDNNIKTKISEIENLRDRGGQLSHDAARRKIDELKSKQWHDGHPEYSDIENPVVRIRFNTRYTTRDVKVAKVLFIEEMQPPKPAEQEKMPAYLIKRWREIGMKRAIQYALDNGYDKVAWTTGEMQAYRYSLDKVVDQISYYPRTKQLAAYKDGNEVFREYNVERADVSKYVGDEVATKLLDDSEFNVVRGQDLKIENKGLRKLYDQDLPNVVKKLGGKVESIDLDFGGATLGKKLPDFITFAGERGIDSEIARRIFMRGDRTAYNGIIAEFHNAFESVQSFSVAPFKLNTQIHYMYSGGPSTEELLAGARAFAKYVKRSRELRKFNRQETKDKLKKAIRRAVFDRSGNVKKYLLDEFGQEGYRVVQYMVTQRGAHPKATRMLEQAFTEMNAKLSRPLRKIRDNYMLAKRVLEISKDDRPNKPKMNYPEEATPIKSLGYVAFINRGDVNGYRDLTPQEVADIAESAQIGFNWIKKGVNDLYNEGIITEKLRDTLLSYDYLRLAKVEDVENVFDKKQQITLGGKKITVNDSGIEYLQRGKKSDQFEVHTDILMLETFSRIYSRIFKNQAGRAMADIARNHKDNPFVRIKESKKDKIPAQFRRNRVFFYENGQRKTLFLAPEIAEEWHSSNAQVTYKYAQVMRYAFGTPLVKVFATGINPVFALKNFPRDVMHIWFAGRRMKDGKWESVYIPTLPIGLGQIAGDVAKVARDAVVKGKLFDIYIDNGGGLEFLVPQGRLLFRGRHLQKSTDAVFDVLGWLGTKSELVTRLAVMHRMINNLAAEKGITYEEALKDKEIIREATFTARDYLDFGQGGDIAKAMDNALPYLNARLQGTRGIFRTFNKDQKYETAWKIIQLAGLFTAAYIGWQKLFPETMDALKNDNRARNNFIIPLPWLSFKDSKGQDRYPFFMIPLDQSQKIIKIAVEAMIDKMAGRPVDGDGVAKAIADWMPVDVTALPPTLSAIIGYWTNTDFWRAERIWKGSGGKALSWPNSKEERYVSTPEFLKDTGDITGFSPERMEYVAGQLITDDNLYAQILGIGYDKLFKDTPPSDKELLLGELLNAFPIVNKFLGFTNPYNQFTELVAEAAEDYEAERLRQNYHLQVKMEQFFEGRISEVDVEMFIDKFEENPKVRERLWDKFRFNKALRERQIPNESFWLSLRGKPVEVRAKIYAERVNRAKKESDKVNLMMEEDAVREVEGKIKGAASSQFKIFTKEFPAEVEKWLKY